MTKSQMGPCLTRRSLIAAGGALPLVGILPSRASAAGFRYKCATGQDPTHPINKRAAEAFDRIRQATGGQVDIKLFPANQLESIRISGVSCCSGLGRISGVVVGEAWIPSFKQRSECAVECTCASL